MKPVMMSRKFCIDVYIDNVTVCVGMMNEARPTVYIWMTIVISEVIK